MGPCIVKRIITLKSLLDNKARINKFFFFNLDRLLLRALCAVGQAQDAAMAAASGAASSGPALGELLTNHR